MKIKRERFNMSDFNNGEFLAWLENQDGPIERERLIGLWPNFPADKLAGCTGPIINGEYCYYCHDLETVAKGQRILD